MTRRNISYIALAVFLLAAIPLAALAQGLMDDPADKIIKTTVLEPKNDEDTFYIQVDFALDSKDIHVYRDQSMDFKPGTLTGAEFVRIEFPEGEDFEGQVVFREKFSLKLVFKLAGEFGSDVLIAGTLSYQGCTDDNMYCYFEDSAISAKGKVGAKFISTTPKVTPKPEDPKPQNGTKPVKPEKQPEEKPAKELATQSSAAVTSDEDLTKSKENWFDSLGIIPFVIMSFIVGLGLSITPCVYPLIPITSGIVKSFGKPTKAGAIIATLIYIFGLVIVYAAVGTISALAGNTVSGILTSPYVLVLLSVIMVVLSLSMFGLYELKLPNKFASKIQQASSQTKQNKIGLLLMGMLSGCIAGPCISGPLAGVLMSITARADVLLGFLSMSAVAVGMSALLFLAGAFNAKLPKAGPWMRKVNMTFGFMLLIMAAYFLKDMIGESIFFLSMGLLIMVWTVFVGAWDALVAESGVAARCVRAVGMLAALAGILLALNGFIELSGFQPFGENEKLNRIALDLASIKYGVDIEALQKEQFQEGTLADVQAALKSGKPIVLDFYGDNCGACEDLAKKFKEPEIVMALRNFKTFKVHNTKQADLAEEYQVGNKIPIVVFINAKGERLRGLRISGNSDTVEELLERIKKCEASAVTQSDLSEQVEPATESTSPETVEPAPEDDTSEQVEPATESTGKTDEIEALQQEQFQEGTLVDVQAALKAGRPIVLDFYGDNCSACKALAKKFKDPALVVALKDFNTFKVHNAKQADLAEEYQVGNKIPIVVFINAKGERLSGLRMSGNSDTVEELLERIKKCEAHK